VFERVKQSKEFAKRDCKKLSLAPTAPLSRAMKHAGVSSIDHGGREAASFWHAVTVDAEVAAVLAIGAGVILAAPVSGCR
jgi:hypothetical protein